MDESVNGIVIGTIEHREYYRFYSELDQRLLWDAGHFESDSDAISAFWDKFKVSPELISLYKKEGVELRIWK